MANRLCATTKKGGRVGILGPNFVILEILNLSNINRFPYFWSCQNPSCANAHHNSKEEREKSSVSQTYLILELLPHTAEYGLVSESPLPTVTVEKNSKDTQRKGQHPTPLLGSRISLAVSIYLVIFSNSSIYDGLTLCQAPCLTS